MNCILGIMHRPHEYRWRCNPFYPAVSCNKLCDCCWHQQQHTPAVRQQAPHAYRCCCNRFRGRQSLPKSCVTVVGTNSNTHPQPVLQARQLTCNKLCDCCVHQQQHTPAVSYGVSSDGRQSHPLVGPRYGWCQQQYSHTGCHLSGPSDGWCQQQ